MRFFYQFCSTSLCEVKDTGQNWEKDLEALPIYQRDTKRNVAKVRVLSQCDALKLPSLHPCMKLTWPYNRVLMSIGTDTLCLYVHTTQLQNKLSKEVPVAL